ncbi:MAG: glycosyltransferase N-terminal domain-containing protein [Pseudomonadota bacterium]
MTMSLALTAYLGLSHVTGGFARRRLAARVTLGKEDPDRLHERLGQPKLKRPKGRLIWFHAASVGESVALLSVFEALREEQPEDNILLTTGTVTSAEVMANRLPSGVIHQYVPVDTAAAVKGFLDHWQPDLALWTESDLWPRLVVDTHRRKIPMMLINASISRKSARRLRWAGAYAAALLNRFEAILAQDDAGADRIYTLGASPGRIEVSGSLKDTAQPLPYDADTLKKTMAQLKGRSVWLAASTHDGEEVLVAAAHREARRRYPGLMLIIAPRHPDRGAEIARRLRADGWRVAVRSQNEGTDRNCEIYLADTLGEMGLWYRVAAVSFIGGSLVEVGGHNPFEPALLGSAILHGPYVHNFETSYARFRRAGAAILVPDAEALGPKLIDALPPDRAAALANAAWAASSEGADVTRHVLGVLRAHLPDKS